MDNTQFYAMLKHGDVDQIKTVGNKKIVRVFINKKAFDVSRFLQQRFRK